LGEHKFGRIAHELKISQQEVADVWEFVKTKLNPHPAHGFSPTNASDRDTRAMYIIPDVVISPGPEDFEVEVVESRRFVLRVNPSTGSRATASKYVMLPNGEVIPYAHFFTPSLSVKDIMKEVIEKEGKPLTDSEIVERLKDRGIHIARRTVAKYRMQLAILPS